MISSLKDTIDLVSSLVDIAGAPGEGCPLPRAKKNKKRYFQNNFFFAKSGKPRRKYRMIGKGCRNYNYIFR
jgi:hypothetical protein